MPSVLESFKRKRHKSFVAEMPSTQVISRFRNEPFTPSASDIYQKHVTASQATLLFDSENLQKLQIKRSSTHSLGSSRRSSSENSITGICSLVSAASPGPQRERSLSGFCFTKFNKQKPRKFNNRRSELPSPPVTPKRAVNLKRSGTCAADLHLGRQLDRREALTLPPEKTRNAVTRSLTTRNLDHDQKPVLKRRNTLLQRFRRNKSSDKRSSERTPSEKSPARPKSVSVSIKYFGSDLNFTLVCS